MAGFPDVLDGILTTTRRYFAFVFLIIIVMGSIAGLGWVLTRILHLNTAQVKFSSEGNQILLQTTSGNTTQYQFVVNPQQCWQPTHIRVEKDQMITFLADGSVNIDLAGLVDKVHTRQKLEKPYEKLKTNTSDTPEAHYGEKQWKQLELSRPWAGPEGGSNLSTYQGRDALRVFPGANYGALVGAILDEDAERPSYLIKPPAAFVIGRSLHRSAAKSGYIWLAVNDVVDLTHPELFLEDNVGYSRVVVTTEKVSSSWF